MMNLFDLNSIVNTPIFRDDKFVIEQGNFDSDGKLTQAQAITNVFHTVVADKYIKLECSSAILSVPEITSSFSLEEGSKLPYQIIVIANSKHWFAFKISSIEIHSTIVVLHFSEPKYQYRSLEEIKQDENVLVEDNTVNGTEESKEVKPVKASVKLNKLLKILNTTISQLEDMGYCEKQYDGKKLVGLHLKFSNTTFFQKFKSKENNSLKELINSIKNLNILVEQVSAKEFYFHF